MRKQNLGGLDAGKVDRGIDREVMNDMPHQIPYLFH